MQRGSLRPTLAGLKDYKRLFCELPMVGEGGSSHSGRTCDQLLGARSGPWLTANKEIIRDFSSTTAEHWILPKERMIWGAAFSPEPPDQPDWMTPWFLPENQPCHTSLLACRAVGQYSYCFKPLHPWRREWLPLQSSGLENSMDKGAWQATVHGVAKSRTWLSNFHFTLSHYVCGNLLLSESEVTQWVPTLCDPMDCSPPGSSVCEISQARILDWVAISFSRGFSRPRDRTQVSGIAGRRFTVWATRESQFAISNRKPIQLLMIFLRCGKFLCRLQASLSDDLEKHGNRWAWHPWLGKVWPATRNFSILKRGLTGRKKTMVSARAWNSVIFGNHLE